MRKHGAVGVHSACTWLVSAWFLLAALVGCTGEGSRSGERWSGADAGPSRADCDPNASYAGFGQAFFEQACLSCHSQALSGASRMGAPAGTDFDSEALIANAAGPIYQRVIVDRTMPPGSPVGSCDLERLQTYLAGLGVTGCEPICAGRQCGDDGCGGSCGSCRSTELCDQTSGQCAPQPCTPNCVARQCGDDGCGGSCGECAAGQACNDQGACICAPDCANRQCGDDGCGGSCGTCSDMLICNTRAGECAATCTTDCVDRMCGDDSCGGTCGACQAGEACEQGQCAATCAPNCDSKECGDDGCGGSCGTCLSAQTCSANRCEYPTKSFSGDVYPLFEAGGCGTANCHGGAMPKADLDMSSADAAYASLVQQATGQCGGGKLLVVPSDPDASYLINKLTGIGMCSGSRMPKGGQAWTTDEINTVRAWIAAGADDD